MVDEKKKKQTKKNITRDSNLYNELHKYFE